MITKEDLAKAINEYSEQELKTQQQGIHSCIDICVDTMNSGLLVDSGVGIIGRMTPDHATKAAFTFGVMFGSLAMRGKTNE